MSTKDIIRSNKTSILNILSGDHSLILNKVQELSLITDPEYNRFNSKDSEGCVGELLDKLMNKGEDKCRRFLDLLETDDDIKETFPNLQQQLSRTRLPKPLKTARSKKKLPASNNPSSKPHKSRASKTSKGPQKVVSTAKKKTHTALVKNKKKPLSSSESGPSPKAHNNKANKKPKTTLTKKKVAPEAKVNGKKTQTALMKVKKKPCGESEPGPAPKPLSDGVNKEPKGPQRVKTAVSTTKKLEKSGKTVLLFGKYKDKPFKWLLHNDRPYASYLVSSHQNQCKNGYNIGPNKENKDALVEYMSHFPDTDEKHFDREGLAPVGFGKYENETRKALYESTDMKKKNYVEWLLKKEMMSEGGKMVALVNYIRYRKQRNKQAAETEPQRSSPKKRAPPEPSSQSPAKKQRL